MLSKKKKIEMKLTDDGDDDDDVKEQTKCLCVKYFVIIINCV